MDIYSGKIQTLIRFMTTSLLLLLMMTTFLSAQKNNTKSASRLNNSELVYQAEKLLDENGYWITKVDRVKDVSTFHAVAAFQKVEGRKITGKLNSEELEAIKKAARPNPVFIGAAHIEIDIKKQVLFLVNENNFVSHILPVSTGNEEIYYQDGKKEIAHTPRGIFSITRQIKGTRQAPLGTLYHPNYFFEGFAIHGSNSVPFYPASHGCVRIPRFAAEDFSDLVSVGLTVIIHEMSGQADLQIKDYKEEPEDISQFIPCERQESVSEK